MTSHATNTGVHVGAAQVECPCYVVESGGYHGCRAKPKEFVAYAAEFAAARFAGIFHWLYAHLCVRNGGASAPDAVENVEVCAQGESSVTLQFFLHGGGFALRQTHPVGAHFLPFVVGEFLSEPLRYGGCAVDAFAHEPELSALQCFLGSDEVA